jgi:predicted DNA-binding protein (MmcQ/YjbR family)
MGKTKPSVLERMKEICLALPGTKLTMTWGKPHFRVGEKIFAGCGEDGDPPSIGFKMPMDEAKRRVETDPRFTKAPYVGHKGWVEMDVARVKDWDEVATLVRGSYVLIAPKRLAAKLTTTD